MNRIRTRARFSILSVFVLALTSLACGDEPTTGTGSPEEAEYKLTTPRVLSGGVARLQWPADAVAPEVVFVGSEPLEVVIDSAGHGYFPIPDSLRGTMELRVVAGEMQETVLELDVLGQAWHRKNEPAIVGMAFRRVVDGVASVVARPASGFGIAELMLPDLTVRQLVPPQDSTPFPAFWGPGYTPDPNRLVHSLTGVIWDVSEEAVPVDTIPLPRDHSFRVVHQLDDTLFIGWNKGVTVTFAATDTGALVIDYSFDHNEASAIRLSPDGRWLIPRGLASVYLPLPVYSVESARPVARLPIIRSEGVAFSPDSRFAFVGGTAYTDGVYGDSVWAYDTNNWRRVAARAVPAVQDVVADPELPLLYVATCCYGDRQEDSGAALLVLDQRTLEIAGSMSVIDPASIDATFIYGVLAVDEQYVYFVTGTDVIAFDRPQTWPLQ